MNPFRSHDKCLKNVLLFYEHVEKLIAVEKDAPLEREAATETIFDYICYFHPGAPFSRLFQELFEFTEQIVILKEGLFARQNDTIFFQEGMSSHRTDTDSQGGLFGYRTDTYFPGSLFQISSDR